VLAYLELDRSTDVVERMVRAAFEHAEVGQHRTSGNIEDSIGRWRLELPRRLHAVVGASLHGPLAELGYELG